MSTCSSVPLRRSSLHKRIVRVAERKINKIGIHSNKGRTSEMFLEKKDSPQKKINNVMAANVAKKMYAIGEEKNRVISLRAIRLILGCTLELSSIAFYLLCIRVLVNFFKEGFQVALLWHQAEHVVTFFEHRARDT